MSAARARPGAVDLMVAAGTVAFVGADLLLSPWLIAAGADSSVNFVARFSFGWWCCLATGIAQAAVLIGARMRPRSTMIVVAAFSLPLATVGLGDTFTLTNAAVMVAVFLGLLAHPLRRLAPALAVTAVLIIAGEFVNGVVGSRSGVETALVQSLLQTLGAIGAPLLVGTAVAGHRDARTAQGQEEEAVDREHRALVRAAVADERTAMAQELHDIAAHHLSGIALMAAAIDRQIDLDPDAAKSSVRQVRQQSTAVLDDLRRLVGLLRTDDDATRSVPSLDAVRELVETRRAAGADVRLRTIPSTDRSRLGEGIGPIAQLALYRIAQESLVNAANHAPGSTIVVEIDDRFMDGLTLRVTNGPGGVPTGPGGGLGLVGMRERADLLGGFLRSGATAGGGWEVQVTIPRESQAEPQQAWPIHEPAAR